MSDSEDTRHRTVRWARASLGVLFWVNAVFWVGYFTWAWLAN